MGHNLGTDGVYYVHGHGMPPVRRARANQRATPLQIVPPATNFEPQLRESHLKEHSLKASIRVHRNSCLVQARFVLRRRLQL